MVFKPSQPYIEEQPTMELKPLRTHLFYTYWGDNNLLPVMISALLDVEQEQNLFDVMKRYRTVIEWTIAGMHKILLDEFCSTFVE